MRLRATCSIVVAMACGGHAPPPIARVGAQERVVREPGHPPIATLERRGDPSAAIALVVDTSAANAPGSVAVALGVVLQHRVAAKGRRVVAQSDAVRLDAWIDSPDAAKRFIEAVRAALATPIDDAAWALAKVALDATPARADGAFGSAQACAGQPSRDGALTQKTLDVARLNVFGTRAVALGVVAPATTPLTNALSTIPAWPDAGRRACAPATPTQKIVYATNDLEGTRVDVLAWMTPATALGAADSLAGAAAPVSLKLGVSDPDARLSEISAVAHPSGGCVDVHLQLHSTEPTVLARDAALVLDEVARISPEGSAPPDPRDAAALIAMTELARGCPVGPPTAMFGAHTEDVATVDAALRPPLEAAVKAWSAPQLDVRKLIETGQAESLVLVASTCGTRVEDGATLGATATVVDGMARHASTDYGVTAEPFVAFDAAGVLVRAHARDAESARDFGLRLADAAARAFFVDTLPGGETTGADAGLTLLAQTLAPNHATWIEPFARTPSSRPPSQGSLDARASAMRRGPVRAVVVASADGAQADAMANALDRYMLRGEARTCASDAHADAPKPGSYVTVRPGPAEAYLALPVGPQCGHAADWLASLLRTDASLSHALAGTVRGSDARLVDAPSGRWLAVHLDAPNAALDAAVAQTRVLLARLHDGAITDGDLKAAQLTVDADLAKALVDPRLRAAAAWRKEPTKKALPTLDAVLACARATLRDEALVIVASRPSVSP